MTIAISKMLMKKVCIRKRVRNTTVGKHTERHRKIAGCKTKLQTGVSATQTSTSREFMIFGFENVVEVYRQNTGSITTVV